MLIEGALYTWTYLLTYLLSYHYLAQNTKAYGMSSFSGEHAIYTHNVSAMHSF